MSAIRRTAIIAVVAALGQIGGCASPSPETAREILVLGDRGLGSIDASTPFDAGALREGLPGFELQQSSTLTEQGRLPVIIAYQDERPALEIYPDDSGEVVGEMHVMSESVRGPNGEAVGMTYAEAGGGLARCFPGLGPFGGRAICILPQSFIEYVYAVSGWDGPDGVLPPDSYLSEAVLVRMIWRASVARERGGILSAHLVDVD